MITTPPLNSRGNPYLTVNKFIWSCMDEQTRTLYRACYPMGGDLGEPRYELLSPGDDGQTFRYPNVATELDVGPAQRYGPSGVAKCIENRRAPGA